MTAMAIGLRSEERVGLVLAGAAHVALVALLIWRPPSGPAVPIPERIEVTISDDVGLTSTSPDPHAQAAPDIAPTIGEAAPAPEPAPPEPQSEPPRPEPPKPVPPRPAPPRPAPKAQPKPAPRPAPQPSPRPAPKAQPAPAPKAAPKAARNPAPPAPRSTPAATGRPAANTAPRPAEKAGGSRIGSDFLKGVQGAQAAGPARSAPAAAIGPAVRSSLASAISRQLKPHWAAPQGADAELLVTVLSFDLNRDGTLAGRPQVVSQSGETEANRAQKTRHAEQAIRAVQLAAPFDLPEQYYDAWKRVSSFRFDRRLSQ